LGEVVKVPQESFLRGRREFLCALAGAAALAKDLRSSPVSHTSALPRSSFSPKLDDIFILNEYGKRCFRYFIEQANENTGLILDRAGADGSVPKHRVSSLAATGFGLTALCIGVERGWIRAEDARDRIVTALRFLRYEAPQVHGFFLHFMNAATGEPRLNSEISSIDTGVLLAGILTAAEYFATDPEISRLAKEIYSRVDFTWMLDGDSLLLSHGFRPGDGFLPYRWDRYSEASILYMLAIASPTHPIPGKSWYAWKRPWVRYQNWSFISGGPLFTHQFAHAWLDFRVVRDADGMDFFRNSVVATYAHRDFCLKLRSQFPEFGPNLWGVTVSDSPTGYVAWGGPPIEGPINGTIVPCAAAGSLMLAPEICLPVLREMLTRYGDNVYGRYGLADAFTPNWNGEKIWIDPDVVGIDIGISLLSLDNLQTGNTWKWFMRSPYVQNGLRKARFRPTAAAPSTDWSQRLAMAGPVSSGR
jgi:hypothetical protein